jgi:hypothetical protein
MTEELNWVIVHASLLLVAAVSAAMLGCDGHGIAPIPTGTGGQLSTAGGGTMAGKGGRGATGGLGSANGGSDLGGAMGGDPATGAAAAMGAAGRSGGPGAGGAAGIAGTTGRESVQPLSMNDVTILLPLPYKGTAVPLNGADLADDGTPFVPRSLFDRLLNGVRIAYLPNVDPYARLQLVAVRFDLCDRHLPGACPQDEDGRLRLVFQPTGGDIGFHAFYAIRNEELVEGVAALRELAKIAATPADWPLQVSPALSGDAPDAYATKLRAFVKRYGGEERLVRLTMAAAIEQDLRWLFRGVEKKGNAFLDMTIVGTTEISETVTIADAPGYDVTPITDTPTGLQAALSKPTFNAADEAKKRGYLAALAMVENPLINTAETVACVGCHVSTVVTQSRAKDASIDLYSIPGRYTSAFNLSTTGGMSADASRSIRALGYKDTLPMISQRVVNDTAQTLNEIRQRYP